METIPTETNGLIANLPTPFTDPGGQSCPNCQHIFFTKNPTTKNFEPRIGFRLGPFPRWQDRRSRRLWNL